MRKKLIVILFFLFVFQGCEDAISLQAKKENKKKVNITVIIDAHKKAMAASKNKRYSASYEILRKSGVENILWEKPTQISSEKYVTILNDYAFFIFLKYNNLAYEDDKIDMSIKILRRIISISPNRSVAHLNLGDALYEKLKHVFSWSEKVKIAKEIDKSYKNYKRFSGKKIERIETFLAMNISQKVPDNICDYILKYANAGEGFQQIISRPPNLIIGEKLSECDIDNDGKMELINIDWSGSTNTGNEFIVINSIKTGKAINLDKLLLESKNKSLAVDDSGHLLNEALIGYPHRAIVPFSNGNYFIAYKSTDSFNHQVFIISKLNLNKVNNICIFSSKHVRKKDINHKNDLCDCPINEIEFNYIKSTIKHNMDATNVKLFKKDNPAKIYLSEKGAFADIDNNNVLEYIVSLEYCHSFEACPKFIIVLNNDLTQVAKSWINDKLLIEVWNDPEIEDNVRYKAFLFKKRYYIEVKGYSFHQIWELNRGAIRILCSYRFKDYNFISKRF